jgi:transposase
MITAVLERCAGIDIGRKQLNVCILDGPAADEPQVTLGKFGTHASELESLRRWLKEHGCTHVAMESTGSYWKPDFEALEQDMTVVLANGEDVKGRRGHKTDWQDCRFLAHLLRHGLIRPSFIPPRAIRDLRDLTRRRRQVIGDATSERNRIQKVLDEASVGIGQVLGDVFGVSGQVLGVLAQTLPERLGKLRVIENPHLPGVQIAGHTLGVTELRQRAENQHSIPTTQHARDLVLQSVR